MSIAILKYGSSNISSLSNCLKSQNIKHYVCSSKKDLSYATTIILPGVGTYEDVIDEIKTNNTFEVIKKKAAEGYKIIGICIGMQIMADYGKELYKKKTKGLGIINGEVIKMNQFHIGWNNLIDSSKSQKFKIFNEKSFYFNHSNCMKLKNKKNQIFYSNIGSYNVPSLIVNKNIFGFQFHPEKSQIFGNKILKHIINHKI